MRTCAKCFSVVAVVCGIHIYNQGSQLGEEIKQWDVKILMVRNVRFERLWVLIFEMLLLLTCSCCWRF